MHVCSRVLNLIFSIRDYPSTTASVCSRYLSRVLKKTSFRKARVSLAKWCWQEEFLKRNNTNTYHYLSASLFFITVKSTETISSTKLAQQETHENSFSQQMNVA
jgi:hypothetical protein